MDDRHRNLIRQNRVYLVENLTLKDVLDHMVEQQIFTREREEQVNKEVLIPRDKKREFLRILVQCGAAAFDTFIAALHATQQDFIANHLMSQLQVPAPGQPVQESGKEI